LLNADEEDFVDAGLLVAFGAQRRLSRAVMLGNESVLTTLLKRAAACLQASAHL